MAVEASRTAFDKLGLRDLDMMMYEQMLGIKTKHTGEKTIEEKILENVQKNTEIQFQNQKFVIILNISNMA